MTDNNENTAILDEAKEWAEPVDDVVNSGVENVVHIFQELQSDYNAGVKEDGMDKDSVSSSIDAFNAPLSLAKDRKRLELLDTIAEVQREFLEIEDVSITYSLL
jgi:hypothetical protein